MRVKRKERQSVLKERILAHATEVYMLRGRMQSKDLVICHRQKVLRVS